MENNEIIVDAEIVEASTNLPAVRTVANSQGTEIVTYGANGEILDCRFQRVDFNVPSTILSYCSDVKGEISAILDSTAQLAISSEEIRVDEKMISNIVAFDQSLDDSEKKKEKEQNLPAVIKGIRGILSTLGIKKVEELTAEEITYKGRYDRYCRGLEEVSGAVESQKQASLNDIALRDEIIAEITPWIEILEEMIKVGKIDKATYDAAIDALRELPQDQDTIHEIQYKSQLSEVFGTNLYQLDKAVIALKEQVQSYRVQQRTDMQAVMEANSYLEHTAPLLKAQGSVMVFNRQQENRITDLARLSEAANTALTNNARDLEQNAQAVVELSLNGGITVETLKELDAALKRGMTIFQKGREQQQQKIAKETKELQALNVSLDGYQQELLNLIDDRTVLEELLKDAGNRSYGPVKTIGTKPATKKGKK